MIENVNESKMPSEGSFADIKKYIGVASVNVLCINPDNAKLRSYGWQIPEDASEPEYLFSRVNPATNKEIKSARVRFLVQITDLEEKPIVSLDFFVRPDVQMNSDGTKCKVIDQYGRTAWGTKEEITAHKIPVYRDGREASINWPYKPCHYGEDELVSFLMKYLNVTPYQIFDRLANGWVPTKNPGKLTIDDWKALCSGDVRELVNYVALQPENRVKVVLGIRTTDNNRAYQTFLNTGYIGNGAKPDMMSGTFTSAQRLIDKLNETGYGANCTYSAAPVKEWKVTATEMKEKPTTMFDDDGNFALEDKDDLPFD